MGTVIRLEGVHNIRDLGGMKVEGGVIRSGRLLRSSRLAEATTADARLLQEEYHLAQIIDLRSHTEMEEAPDVSVPGAAYEELPLIDEEAMGMTRDKESMRDMMTELSRMPDMTEMYKGLASVKNGAKWRHIFDLLLTTRDGAVLWHCSEGKDRCGMVSAMVLSSLGAARDDILADYLKTNQAAEPRAEAMYRMALEKIGDEALAQKVKAVFLAKEEYFQAAFAAVEESFGSVDGFLEQVCGLNGERRQELRKMYCNLA